jgi:hypothetical protein
MSGIYSYKCAIKIRSLNDYNPLLFIKNWTNAQNSRIKMPYHESFCNFIFRRDYMSALRDTFEDQREGVSRRKVLGGLSALAGAAMFAAVPGANDAQAGEAKASAIALTPLEMRDEMADFARAPNPKGIGVFINLQADAPMTGDEIGEWIQKQFDPVDVRVAYHFIQSKGTATDITFYIPDSTSEENVIPIKVNVSEINARLPEIYQHYRDHWRFAADNNAQPG